MHPCNAERLVLFTSLFTSFLVNKMTDKQVCIYSTLEQHCVHYNSVNIEMLIEYCLFV